MNDSFEAGGLYPRLVGALLDSSREYFRVIWVGGPRQAGKSTLVQQVATDDMPYISLDDQKWREAASRDPHELLSNFDRLIIDEVQIVPDLINAVKLEVDNDSRKGRYILTGSANILTIPRITDSLAGRMRKLRLMPLSQVELRGGSGEFLQKVFSGEIPAIEDCALGPNLVDIALSGGFPEAVAVDDWNAKHIWLDEYIDNVVTRDSRDIDEVEEPLALLELARILPLYSGKIVNHAKISEILTKDTATVKKYMRLLEQMYLFQSLPSWQTNSLKALTKAPKLFLLDSGLMAALQKESVESIKYDRSEIGAIIETFVFAELLKQTTWNCDRWNFSYMRSQEGKEVDIVIENRVRKVVGIEVKASSNVSASDFSGLQTLAEACGDRFVQGIILYDSSVTRQYKDKFVALPISALWC